MSESQRLDAVERQTDALEKTLDKAETIRHILAYHSRWNSLGIDYKEQLARMEQERVADIAEIVRVRLVIEQLEQKKFAAEQMLRPLGYDVGW